MSQHDIDKGWAWVVLAAAAVSQGIFAMSMTSVVIFQVEFLQIFQGPTSLISLIGSLHLGFQLFIGPVASIICNTYSIRVGAMLGASILSVGFILSSWSSSYEELLVYFGLIAGSGSGIMYTSVSVICSHYFHEKRLIACGITFSTPGIGYILGPALSRYLIDNFGWRMALGIHSYMCAQVCVLGALFFPIDENTKTCLPAACGKVSNQDKYTQKDDGVKVVLSSSINPKRIKELKPANQLDKPRNVQQRTTSVLNGGSQAYLNNSNDSLSHISVQNYSILADKSSNPLSSRFLASNQTINSLSPRSHYGSGSIMWQSHWSMQHVGTYLADEEAREAGEEIGGNSKTTCAPDLTVLKNKSIWCLSLSQFLLMCGYGIHFVHFPSMLISKGIDISVVPQFYMTQGVCVIFSRLFGGLFCSSPGVDILVVFFGCQALLGTNVFCVPFMGSKVWAYHIFQVAFAMYYGGAYVLLSQILVKLLGLRHLATGFGLQMMMAGIAFFITPTLAGWLYDITGSYDGAYYTAGSSIFVGSFLILMIEVLEPSLSVKNEPHQHDIVIEIQEINIENTE